MSRVVFNVLWAAVALYGIAVTTSAISGIVYGLLLAVVILDIGYGR